MDAEHSLIENKLKQREASSNQNKGPFEPPEPLRSMCIQRETSSNQNKGPFEPNPSHSESSENRAKSPMNT